MDLQKMMNDLQKKSGLKVKFVAENGPNTCAACRENDGKVFNINDADLPMLPIHPNCRCKFVKIEDEEQDASREVEQQRIVNNFVSEHQISESESKNFAQQILAVRTENGKIRDQKLFLLFNGRYLMSSDGKFLADAVAGKPVEYTKKFDYYGGFCTEKDYVKNFDYSYERQGIENVGGLPCGLYSMECREGGSLMKGSFFKHVLRAEGWGNYHWRLIPDPATDMRQRKPDSFTIHGGSIPKSSGCIDLTQNDNAFRNYLQTLDVSKIYVYVRYNQVIVPFEWKRNRTFSSTEIFD